MYENKYKKPLSSKAFRERLSRNFFLALIILFFSILLGMGGYHIWGQLGWVDSFYNASMILTGMGPVDQMPSAAGKIFASFYALYSGVAFLSTIAVVLVPVIHRGMHKFHFDTED